jgi:N-acetyl-gamma-glutamyl-phosphate reductase
MAQPNSLGIIGARGHVGAELIRLVAGHPALELAFVGSRELDGQRVSSIVPQYRGEARYEALDAAGVAARRVDAVVLALPNGMAAPYVAALDAAASGTAIVDVSADYRFDDTWFYGLPELNRARHAGQRRISNPGCYATAMQLAIAPMLEVLARPAQCFGVSGYSGAGTTPSDKNDTSKLRDNLMPYSLVGHLHEREVTRHLGHPVEFMPHVAPHFRGITMTVNLHLKMKMRPAEVRELYDARYAGEPLVRIGDDPPWVSRIAGRHGVEIGGFALSADSRRLVVVATLDNLLKGAATQAMQNLNLALGLPELTGISLADAFAPAA